MGYVYYSFQDQLYRGSNQNITVENILSPYNFISSSDESLYKISIPFSMNMITLNPELPKPYQFTVISPGYYMYIDLDQKEYMQQIASRGQHQHNTIEIMYAREGEYYQQIEARRYKYSARSCCLLNRNVRHREEFTSSFSVVTLSLSYAFIRELLNDPLDRFFQTNAPSWKEAPDLSSFFHSDLPGEDSEKKSFLNFTPTPTTLAENDDVHDIFDQLAQLLVSPSTGSSHIFRALITQLLTLLCDTTRYSTDLIHLGTETESRIFSRITELMEQTHGRITRQELTEQLNYSGTYLNRIVHKYSGRNITQYGDFFSMQQAARLLQSTKESISQIASELGFTDRTHFYELFRQEYGMTPREYRKLQKN